MLSTDFILSLIQANPSYLEDLYQQFLLNPEEFGTSKERLEWVPLFKILQNTTTSTAPSTTISFHNESSSYSIKEAIEAKQFLDWYRHSGHLCAQINPLNTTTESHLKPKPSFSSIPNEPSVFGPFAGLLAPQAEALLDKLYCQHVGVEMAHMTHAKEKQWLLEQIEINNCFNSTFSKSDQLRIYDFLYRAESFEQFLHTKYVGSKRFSLEGAESFIAGLAFLLEQAADQSVLDVFLGMAHRGRLNTLKNILGKPAQEIFSEFENFPTESAMESTRGGDVKYHMGYSNIFTTQNKKQMNLSLAFNPSHLESVNPVVLGQVRAKQTRLPVDSKKNVLGILVHGDAAFVGQGIVYETLNLAQLNSHTTCGTLHIVINNQIGFTTNSNDSRSMRYCTEPSKLIGAPIFHVNGDQVEQVILALYLALQYRQNFQKDAVVDICCYRKYGHNETDEPTFTQPLMYKDIASHPSVVAKYKQNLIERGIASAEDFTRIEQAVMQQMEQALLAAKTEKKRPLPQKLFQPVELSNAAYPDTKLSKEALAILKEVLIKPPAGFTLHPKIARLLKQREEMLAGLSSLDFGLAELMGIGNLLIENIPVRLVGQDSRRGTFSQRQALWVDIKTGQEFIPLQKQFPSLFEVYDSALSEEAVLGYEYGYSVQDLKSLVLFEAQFGDFINGAQVIIDQFIAAGEEKWGQRSNIVLLLPHGYEGQGPEHSSARLERFLQLSAKNNWQVAYPSTSAQYFHLLKRQAQWAVKKPLVILSPKSLLRNPMASSPLAELSNGKFEEILVDTPQKGESSSQEKLVFCTGKLYYDLLEERTKRASLNVTLVRIEQLYPFPKEQLVSAIKLFKKIKTIYWAQEEPYNMGAREFVVPQLKKIFDKNDIVEVCRMASPSTATGSLKQHVQEQKNIIKQIFD